MRKQILSALILATALAAGASAKPAGPPQLYRLDETPLAPAKGQLAIPEAVEEFAITLDPKLVDSNPEVLAIQLPSGPLLEAHRNRFVIYEADWKSWSGELRHPGAADPMGYVLLVYHGDFVTGLLNTDEGRFRLAAPLDRGPRLVRVKDAGVSVCPVDGGSHAGPEVPRHSWRPRQSTPKSSSPIVFDELVATRIDVLALYTKDFFAFPLSEVSMLTFVRDSISLGNDIFANTGVNAVYNLLQTLAILDPVQKPPATGLADALNWMNTQAGVVGSELNTLRTAFGADVVTLYIPYLWTATTACGIANLPNAAGGFNPGPGTFGDKAFSANRYDCGYNDYTLAHEIGHNYGMRHNNTSDVGAKYSYGKGYEFPPAARTNATVMGCWCPSGPCAPAPTPVCNRIPYFSDPDILYGGVPIGDATHRNADVAIAEVANYAAFKPQSANTPPTALVTCPASCPGGTCTFNGSASTDNVAIPAGGYRWDFADGTSLNGKIVNKAFTCGTSQWIHLTVTDSGGQRDLGLDLCNVNC